jgi:hypothetical protein
MSPSSRASRAQASANRNPAPLQIPNTNVRGSHHNPEAQGSRSQKSKIPSVSTATTMNPSLTPAMAYQSAFSATCPTELTSHQSAISPDMTVIADLLSTMKETLSLLGSTFDSLGDQTTRVAELGPAIEISKHVIIPKSNSIWSQLTRVRSEKSGRS